MAVVSVAPPAVVGLALFELLPHAVITVVRRTTAATVVKRCSVGPPSCEGAEATAVPGVLGTAALSVDRRFRQVRSALKDFQDFQDLQDRRERTVADLRLYCLESLRSRLLNEQDENDYLRGYRQGFQAVLDDIRRVEMRRARR